MAGNIEETNVKIGAETEGLQTGMKQAENVVETSTASIQGSLNKMAASAGSAMAEMNTTMKSAFSGISGAMSKLSSTMVTVGAVLAGGAAFKSVISETVTWTGEAVKLSKQLGVTTEEASLYNTALGNVFLSTETLTTAVSMITRTLATNEDAFKKLGVETRDSSNHFRSSLDIMNDVNEVLRNLREGTDRNVAGMTIYKRSWGEVQGILKVNSQVLEEAKQEMDDYNKTVDSEKAAQVKKYKEAMENVGDVFEGIKLTIGTALLPALTSLGEFFSSIGPASCVVIKGALQGVITFFEMLALGAVTSLQIIAAALNSVLVSVWNLAGALSKLVTGDFKGAWETLKAGGEQVKQQWIDSFNAIESYGTGTVSRLSKIWGFDKSSGSKAAAPQKEQLDPDSLKKDKEDKSRVPQWESELEQMKEAEGNFFKDSKASDLAYWQAKLDRESLSSEEQRSIRHKIFQYKAEIAKEELAVELQKLKDESDAADAGSLQRIDIARQEAELIKDAYGEQSKEYAAMLREIDKQHREFEADQNSRRQGEIETTKALAMVSIDMERDRLSAMKEMGAVTDLEEIEALKILKEKEYTVELDAANKKLELLREGSLDYQTQINTIQTLEAKHVQTMQALNLTMTQAISSRWTSVFSTITSGFSSAIQSMIIYGNRFGASMKQLAASILGTFINMGVQMVADWIKKQILMTAATQAQNIARTTSTLTANTTAAASTASTAMAEVGANAAVAASGAASSQASIPYVGPILAAAAAASMMGMVLGMKSSIASAAGGWEVPEDQIAQVHKNEMILPAELSDKIRNITDPGPSDKRAAGGGTTIIQAMDAKSFKRFIKKNGSAVMSSMAAQYRNFNSGMVTG